jgi:anti-sigma28 factor (negative regulator of flagellin synthesis)
MQEYYIKRAKECEQQLQQLKAQSKDVDTKQVAEIKAQIAKVAREMANYRAAISTEVS